MKLALRSVLYYRGILESWARDGSASVNESGLDRIQGLVPTFRPHLTNVFFPEYLMLKCIVGSHYIFVKWIDNQMECLVIQSPVSFVCLGFNAFPILGNYKDSIKPTKIRYGIFLSYKAFTSFLKINFGNNFSLISHDDKVKQLEWSICNNSLNTRDRLELKF